MPLYRWEIIRRKKPLIGPQIHDVSQVLYLPFDKDHEPYSVEPYNPTQVLRLPFEDPPQEITYDRSGYGNDGTIYGATRVIGKVRNALYFDGVDDYVEVAHSASLNLATPFTVGLWINSSKDYAAWAIVIGKRAGLEGRGWSIHFSPTELIRFELYDGVNSVIVGTKMISDGKWHHVTAVRDNVKGEIRIYVDGVFDESTSDTIIGDITHIDPLYIARGGGDRFQGFVDEVRIYNRVLSLSEIKRLMNLRGV